MNIDKLILSLEENQIKMLEEENPSLNVILSHINTKDVKAIKFKVKFTKNIFDKKNIVSYDAENNRYYYHYLLTRTYDILKNFKCTGHETTLSFSGNFHKFYTPSSMVPICVLNNDYVYLNILLDDVPTQDLELQISYDAFIISQDYKQMFINYELTNDDNMSFMYGMLKK